MGPTASAIPGKLTEAPESETHHRLRWRFETGEYVKARTLKESRTLHAVSLQPSQGLTSCPAFNLYAANIL